MATQLPIHGLLAEFAGPEELLAAARGAYAAGYRHLDAYSPFPVEGLAEAIGFRGSGVPWIVLAGGVVGAAGGFGMQWFASVIDYPLNVGGRPLFSWPAFIPITFEMMVLCAAFSALIGLLALNGLPQPYHPVFNAPEFARASQDRFFLCIEATDPQFDRERAARFLQQWEPRQISEVAH